MCHHQYIIKQILIFCIYVKIVCTNENTNYESAQYLQNAISDLKKLSNIDPQKNIRRSDPTVQIPLAVTNSNNHQGTEKLIRNNENIKDINKNKKYLQSKIDHDVVPPLSLTKGELVSLYESALSKGNTIKLDTGENGIIHAAVHEIPDGIPYVNNDHSNNQFSNNDESNGYYYYYYPLKSFVDEISSHPPSGEYHSVSSHDVHTQVPTASTMKSHLQLHSHTHQEEKKEKKALQPLFMAISGFIGMAVMFMLSVLIFPKFGIKKTTTKRNDGLNDLTRIALKAIDGKDCTQRIACEITKTARNFPLFTTDNRFFRFIKRIMPSSFTKNVERMGRLQNNSRFKCTAIPCRSNTSSSTKSKPQKNPKKKS